MFKKFSIFLIVIVFIAIGCTPDTVTKTEEVKQEQDSEEQFKENEPEQTNDTVTENNREKEAERETVQNPELIQTNKDQVRPEEKSLISREETVKMFFDAWQEKDLEKMDMLTVQRLEDFFRNSDILFSSYHYLDSGDIAGFIRDGLDTLAVYDEKAFDNIEIKALESDENVLLVSMGDAFNLSVVLEMDDHMWKLKMIDSSPAIVEKAIPQEWGNLDNTVIADSGDLNGDGNPELVTTGVWGEWEGFGPEPSSAIGIYSYGEQDFQKIYFKGIDERLTEGRVVVDGGVGYLNNYGNGALVIIEKTAVDELGSMKPEDIEYYLSLYTLEEGNLVKTDEIDWKALISDLIPEDRFTPTWVELLGIQHLKDDEAGSIVAKIGMNVQDAENRIPGIIEGIFVFTPSEKKWNVDWHHIGKEGEYHTVVFGSADMPDGRPKLYYIEDSVEGQTGGCVREVFYDGDKWEDIPVFGEKMDIKAAADMDGDGVNEFLLWDKGRLKIISRKGNEMWSTEVLNGTKDVPYAWMGIVDGKQAVIAALHRGTYVYWKSQVFKWEGESYNLSPGWNSEDLGTEGISAMKMMDIDSDEKPEILVNFSNYYLIRGQYFRIYEP